LVGNLIKDSNVAATGKEENQTKQTFLKDLFLKDVFESSKENSNQKGNEIN
jgi:hypothetical protein